MGMMGAAEMSTLKWKAPPGIFQPDGVFGLALGASQSPLKVKACASQRLHESPGIP
jgi:hypothetical protein